MVGTGRLFVGAALTIALAATAGHAAAKRVAAPPTASALLQQSAKAGARLDYSGTRRLAFYGGETTREVKVRVIHLRPDRTRMEFLGPGRMQGAVRIEIGKDAWRYSPRDSEWRPSASHEAAAMDVARLLANYTVTQVGSEQIAGRRCHVIAIRPKRPGNPSRRVWVDAATALPLKSQFFGADGALVSEAGFTAIQFAVPKSLAALVQPPKNVAAPRQPEPALDFDPIKPAYLPPGYELVASAALSARGRPSWHLQYSDGLGTISVFEQRVAAPTGRDDSGRPERRHRGARGGAFGGRPHFPSALRWRHGDLRFTLIGDVSPQEIGKIAASLPGGQDAQPPPQGRPPPA